jgi:hypothetical protein
MRITRSLAKLLTDEDVVAVDPHNKILFLRYGKRETAVKYATHGYIVHTIGEIHFARENAGKYIMPGGCSPADVQDGNTVVTALHCISDINMRPKNAVSLLVINESLPEIAKIDAMLKDYTPLKKCGLICRLLLFFRWLPETYINYREIAWLWTPISLNSYKPLPSLETIGVLTAVNESGDYMLFSPLPGKENKIYIGSKIAYISFDYVENKIVYVETTVGGYAFANILGYIFYLPYAYEPGRLLARPGFSGSAIKKIDIFHTPDRNNE